MAEISIRNGHPSEVMQDDRREATEGLADDLRRKGYEVDLQIVERIPGRYGLTQIEWPFITIVGGGVSTGLVSRITEDAYDAAKRRLRARREAKDGGRHLGVTILGPDGKDIKNWSTRDDD
jgi:hypothetical protein